MEQPIIFYAACQVDGSLFFFFNNFIFLLDAVARPLVFHTVNVYGSAAAIRATECCPLATSWKMVFACTAREIIT